MKPNFFRETFPIVLLWGIFIWVFILNFLVELGVWGEGDIVAVRGRGVIGAVIWDWVSGFIFNHNLFFRFFATGALGCLPSYLMMLHGSVKAQYQFTLYFLIGAYMAWFAEKAVRVTISKLNPRKSDA